ncbi:16782_t:CDS:2, partial [Cetraspora pellucida]
NSLYNNKFYLSNNEKRNNSNDEALPSIFTSNLKNNQKEEVEKAQCLFKKYNTEYL